MHTDIGRLSPKDLFQKDIRYTIPPFQRPYVWTHHNQWEPLWDDVRNVADTYLEEMERTGGNRLQAQENTKPHFLGAVVLKQVPTAAKDIEQREVIDGQQRVTTLQLLLDAMQEVCEELKLESEAKYLSKLVTNDKDLVGGNSDHIFKMWPTRSDREAFRHAMQNGLAIDDYEDSLIVRSHEFFKLQVKTWLGYGTESIEGRIEALETAVIAMLQMVVIDLNSSDDPHVIFETLNARGTPLEQSDLIKNYVVSQSSNSNGVETDVWDDLGDKWWREEVRQGRLFRTRIDMLINYWLAMRIGSEVSPSTVFTVFRRHASERGVADVMLDLKSDLGNYKKYETKPRTREDDMFHHRTGVMQAGVITPALLILLKATPESRIKSFAALESFLIRRMVCRLSTKDYNNLILELVARLQRHGIFNAERVVAEFLKAQEANSRIWPNDRDLKDAFQSSQLYRLLTRGRLRLVLEGIEGQLKRSPMTESTEVPRNLTIEHLMPQSWGQNWPLPKCVDQLEGEHVRNQIVHTIGNLTLLTGKMNQSLSNAKWECKRKGLDKYTDLFLNRKLVEISSWDEESIKLRSECMADLFAKIWPGPESSVWDE